MTADVPRRVKPRHGREQTVLEKRAQTFEIGAPLTGAVTAGDAVAAAFGDGTVHFFRPGLAPVVAQAHSGVVLCIAADGSDVLTGGDDGRFLRVSPDGSVEEIASFGTRWVDCVASGRGLYACSSGRVVHVWSGGKKIGKGFEHPSTVGGIAFDAKGKRMAAGHYGGATVWERGERRWKASKFVWGGSHSAVTFSPDGKFLVSSMQENALHGWRLRDKNDIEMAGYPAKIKTFSWVGATPHLATSGADEVVCWPFDGKNGPLGRGPVCVAYGGKQIATVVQAFPGEEAVVAGFQDGTVLLEELDETKEAMVLRVPTGTEVAGIAVAQSRSHILIGDVKGSVLWASLTAE
ncbi:MAG: WD40 repeat domain-containing protein [Pseudomonadota bacterium]